MQYRVLSLLLQAIRSLYSKVRALSTSLAQSQTCFQIAPCCPLHSVCVAYRQDLETLPGKDGVQFGNCKITFLQIMWFCCLHSEHDLQPQNSLQLRVKQPGRESAPPSLRPWLLENRGLPLSWGIECSW